ncbi:hypothetical protein [Myxacorys almedinensis]|uniref:Antibiotic biosynthesis monooxygenase n=1 Tax=Myxacorys almedinensis A TaxID=2690445 RepID=A0A8J8CL46_9CYAN|nr:hypothetical protein [Myxacorys almedinensis]NDJ17345.1 hypothetical protein [Myxacorys almedinensis A]
MTDSQEKTPFYSSLVVEHIVPKGKDFAFKKWHTEFTNAAKRHPGFIRLDLTPPLRCEDPVVKWYSIAHFDTPERLDAWIESDDRKRRLALGQRIFEAYRFKSFTTGLEGWFSFESGSSERVGLGPPTWKQILAVVLGLYPIIMIQSRLFDALGIMQSWSPPLRTLVSLLITSTILSLVVMPIVSKGLSFWLKPAHRLSSRKDNAVGGAIVAIVLTFLVSLFHYLP